MGKRAQMRFRKALERPAELHLRRPRGEILDPGFKGIREKQAQAELDKTCTVVGIWKKDRFTLGGGREEIQKKLRLRREEEGRKSARE